MKEVTKSKIQKFVYEYYKQAKQAVVFAPFSELIVNLVEQEWVDQNGLWKDGGKIYFDIRGIEANYIKYPSRYQNYLDVDYSNTYNDAMAMHEMTKLIRKVYNIADKE